MGPIEAHLSADHVRLDALLRRADADPARIDREAFAELRAGLLRHIGIEQKILLPDARRRRGGEPLPVAERLRQDHAAIAALLVPTPTHAIVAELRARLERHNPLEEGPGGLYEVCDQLAGAEVEEVVARMHAYPPVPLAPHRDWPNVLAHVARLLARPD
jgi:hypothetical protein